MPKVCNAMLKPAKAIWARSWRRVAQEVLLEGVNRRSAAASTSEFSLCIPPADHWVCKLTAWICMSLSATQAKRRHRQLWCSPASVPSANIQHVVCSAGTGTGEVLGYGLNAKHLHGPAGSWMLSWPRSAATPRWCCAAPSQCPRQASWRAPARPPHPRTTAWASSRWG